MTYTRVIPPIASAASVQHGRPVGVNVVVHKVALVARHFEDVRESSAAVYDLLAGLFDIWLGLRRGGSTSRLPSVSVWIRGTRYHLSSPNTRDPRAATRKRGIETLTVEIFITCGQAIQQRSDLLMV